MNRAGMVCGKTRNYKSDSALREEVQGAFYGGRSGEASQRK